MRYLVKIFLLLQLSNYWCQAQVLKGKISTESGDPVQYATVYIQELRQGTTSNTKGDYEIKLPSGKYTVIYQSLGFAPVFAEISVSDQIVTKNVVLPLQYYQIPEVRISATGEDPAYIVMRKVIGLAPYYLNNISYYKAEVYLKGNLVVNRIPKILAKSMKVETKDDKSGVKERTIKAGDSFMMESFNEMEYTAPDKYHQKVISYNSTFPEEGNEISPMEFIQASFYQPLIADMAISPLSPSAFSHYNFKYLGASLQGNFTINKIQVIPKRKSQQLFEGTIYIIEDLWCLHSVDLTNENLVGKIRVQQLYIPVHDEIWMPVSHKFEINISVVGFKGDAGYGSSIKYIDVKPNLSLHKPQSISTDFSGRQIAASEDSVKNKINKQIDKILEKDELSNRDMVRLSRLVEKESKKSIRDSASLEIKDNTTHVIQKDAGSKDSSYWAEIRPIPLTEVEKRSLRISDSIRAESFLIKMKSDTTSGKETKDQKQTPKFFRTIKKIGRGYTWTDKKGFSFTYGGLIDLTNFSFNTVDGFVYGIDFRLGKTWKNKHSLTIFPDTRWAFSREQLLWRVNANYNINGLKPKQIYIRTGITSKDLSRGPGINPFLNTSYTLLLRKNYLKLYESRYITLGYKMEISNGIELEISTGFEDRRTLENTTNFSIFRPDREYTENIPVNSYLGSNPLYALRDQRHLEFVTHVTYTPKMRYKIQNGNKINTGSDWPTFDFTWEHGINEFSELEDRFRHFDMLRADIFKTHDIGALSRFRWRVSSAGFVDNSALPFYDFLSFNSQPLFFQINDYQDSFMIPAFYSLTSPEITGEVHVKYSTPYLLLKFLPFLSNTLMLENISLSCLGTFKNGINYTEAGYSLSQIFLMGEIGIYVGFDNFTYRSIGAKAAFRFN